MYAGREINVDFMFIECFGSRGRVICMNYVLIFRYFLLYSGTSFRQVVCIVIMSKDASTKLVKCMAPKLGVLVLRWTSMVYIIRIHYFFTYILNSCTPNNRIG